MNQVVVVRWFISVVENRHVGPRHGSTTQRKEIIIFVSFGNKINVTCCGFRHGDLWASAPNILVIKKKNMNMNILQQSYLYEVKHDTEIL